MKKTILSALAVTFFTLLLTGVFYPLFTTGIAQLAFNHKANGSLVKDASGSRVIGSELLAQSFSKPEYFHVRPSIDETYSGLISGGSNLGTSSDKFEKSLNDRIKKIESELPISFAKLKIPVDMVTASASGLDPHISIEAAMFQVPRIAKARNKDMIQISEEIEKLKEDELGPPRVNVLLLNIALDESLGIISTKNR